MPRRLTKFPLAGELSFAACCIALLVYAMHGLLLSGKLTLSHDALAWEYPLFHSIVESGINGEFPLWNPYAHAGEPLYPLLNHFRLLDPVTLLTVGIGPFFTRDTNLLFCWNRFLQTIFMALGAHLVLRRWAACAQIRLLLIPILFFSSFFFVGFRQHGCLFLFLWVPYVAYFLLRVVRDGDHRWSTWLFLAATIGISNQSYYFVGTWFFLLFFFAGLLLFRRDLLRGFLASVHLKPKLLVAITMVGLMMLPNLVLCGEEKNYVSPARMVPTGYERLPLYGGPMMYEAPPTFHEQTTARLPYPFIAYSGTHSNIWDFLQMVIPAGGNSHIGLSRFNWGMPSEAYIYLGLVPWAMGVIGIFLGKDDLKRIWLFLAGAFALLMLGPEGELHRLLYQFFPPAWLIRHTHMFVLFFDFSFLYFTVLGLNYVSEWGGIRDA